MMGFTFKLNYCIDHMLKYFRSGNVPFFGYVPYNKYRDAISFGCLH